MLVKSRLVAALALLCCCLPFASRAAAQDTRTVNEPTFPATCTTLTAQQAISAGEPASETAFDTTRIQAALTACASGKAVELVASGVNNAFLIGPLTLPTGVTLVVDAGVTVFGSRNPADYQIAGAGIETCGTVGTKGNGCNNLITASNTTGAGVMGFGIVNGRGGDKLILNGVTQTYSWWDLANNANTSGGLQNNPILLYATKAPSFTLYKITLMNSPMVHVKYQNATGFTAWGIKIIAPYSARNTDGIDPIDSITNATITNSYISDGDDDIAIGATAGNPVQNITISNNHTYSGRGVSIGSYTAGGVSNIAVTNLNMAGNTSDANAAGLKIKSSQDRGGLVNNVQYTGVCIQNERFPLQFNPTFNTATGTSFPQYKNIGLHNVTITSLNNSTYQFQGLNANVPLGLTFDNLNIAGGIFAVPAPQYANIVLGPGPVTPVQLQQYAGRGVTYSGNITNPSETPYRCPATNFPFLAGELFLSNATTTNQQSLAISNTASVTLNAVVEPVESASTTPASPIQFYEGNTQVGTGTLGGNGTVATLTLSNLTSGAHTYTARYPADTAYAVVNFGSVTVNVNTTATTTTMTATPTTAVYGNSVALVATVATTGTTIPTGNVSFQSGGTVLGTVALDATGKGTLNSTTLPVGTNSIAAYFAGSTNFSASNSSATPITVTITAANSTTTVAAAPANAAYGATVTVTSTVASATTGTPTGTVTILDGGNPIGTATLSGNTAVFTTTTLAAGAHSLTSVYGGDTNFNGSTSATAANVTVFTSSTTTSLGFSGGSVPFGSSVTMIATINNGNAPTATGNVTFTDNGTLLAVVPVANSSASYTTSALPLGSNTIVATYSGDNNYTGSSATAPITVNQAGTMTTLAATSNTPTFGTPDTFTATVTPTSSGTPSGLVTFKDGAATLGTGMLSAGQATYTTSALTGGNHSITATYPGDTNYTGSTSAALAVTVGTAATTTTVSQPAAITYGASASLAATVTSTVAGTLTGSVAFYDGTILLGSGTLTNGTATYSAPGLTGGSHTITAVYTGDTNFATSTGAGVTLTVNKASSTVAVSANPTTLVYGNTTTLTATLTPSGATGMVTFLDGGNPIGTVTSSGGTAQLTTGVLTAGTHSITVSYSGDGNYNTSTSTSAASVTVTQATSTTTVTAAPTSITFGNSTVLTATVPSAATGTVTFKDGTATLGTGLISGGKASFTATALTGGNHSITAVFPGDNNYTTSTSPAVTVTVGPAITTTTLTATPSIFAYGTSTTFTATISNTAATGMIAFKDGSSTLATIPAANGTASYSTAALTGGSHSITAVYLGDTNYATSTSSAVTVTVNAAATTTAVSASPATLTFGGSTTLTATVTGSGATGLVTFRDGTNPLGTGTLTNGTATFVATALAGGTHSITAVYAGDGNYATSTSGAFNVTVNTATITGTLVANPTTAGFGSTITFTVTLSNTAATGTVTFSDGAAFLGTGKIVNGVASFATGTLAVGNHSITGTYSGDSNYAGLTTAAAPVSITQATTTSTVSANPASFTYGGATLLTATVSSPAATGTFSFRDNGVAFGSGTIANGVATYNATALGAGTHSITAVYLGDANFSTSTSAPVTVTVSLLATTTSLTANPTTLNFGASTTLTATVSNSNATGSVTFADGGKTLGSGTIANGIATYTTSALAVGPHSITASYPGDGNYAASASSAVTVTVSMATTTSTISATPSNSAFGTTTAITVTVAPSGATGQVTFRDGANSLGFATLVNGTATINASLAAGTHTLSASYAGDGNYAGSATTTSASVVITVAASVVVAASAPSSTPFGTAVNLSASVTPSAATGTITFRDSVSGLAIGQAQLSNGSALLSGVLLSPAGSHGITAMYSGDANVGGSTSAATLVNITPGTSVATLTASPASPIMYGTTLTLATTNSAVLGVMPTGTVQYMDGTTALGSAVTLANGATQRAVTTLMPGTHSITAVYSGDQNYAAYTSAAVTVTVIQSNSTLTLTAVPQQTVPGQAFNLTATATSNSTGTPTGSATFFNSANQSLGTVNLVNGVALLSQTLNALGTATYTATYSGDIDFNPASSQPITVTVKQLSSATTILATPTSGTFGSGTYTVSSTVSSTGGGVPTGSVTYRDISGTAPVTLGTAPVSANGTAALSGITLGGGTHTIVAFYSGDPTYVSSDTTSAPATITVATAASSTALSVTPATSTFGTAVTFSATVTNTTGTTATGTVLFRNGATVLGMGTLVNGTYSFTTSTLPIAGYSVTAVYSGDTNFSASSSAAATVTVTQIPQTITLTGVPASLTYGAAPFVIGASSGSGLAVGLTVSGPATLSGSTITVTGAGTIVLTATQPGNATYAPAPTVVQSIVVGKAIITVTVTNQSILAGAAIPTLTGALTGVVNGDNITVGYSTTATSASAPGTYPITATLADPSGRLANYTVSNTPGTLTITANAQTITFPAIPTSAVYGSASLTLTASASSKLAVTYTVTGPGSLNGSVLAINGTGSITVTASQAGNNTYSAAAPVSQTIIISPAPLSVVVNNLSIAANSAIPTLTGTLTGVVNGDNITAGYATTATQTSAPGTYPITATLNDPGSRLANYTVTNTPGTLTITSNSQTVTFPAIATAVTYGAAPVTLSATASSGLPITYTVTGPATLAASILTYTGAGTVTVTAAQPGNQSYSAATSVTQTVVVAKANLTITVDSFTRPFGAANPTLTGTVTGVVNGDAITVSYATTATAASPNGTYPITATLADPNNRLVNYNVTNTAGTLTIVSATTAVTLTSSATTVAVGLPVTFTANVLSGGVGISGTITFQSGTTLLGTSTATNGVATLTLNNLALGTYTVTATYVGTANNAAATSNVITVTVVAPYSIALNPSLISLKASGSGTSVLTITPAGGFTGTVTASCSSPVAYITCSVSAPAAITGATAVTSNISINIAAMTSLTVPRLTPSRLDQTIAYATLLPLGALLLLPLLRRRKALLQLKAVRLLTLALFALVTTAFMTGCGGANNFNTSHTVPVGDNKVTITVTAGGVTTTTILTVNIAS